MSVFSKLKKATIVLNFCMSILVFLGGALGLTAAYMAYLQADFTVKISKLEGNIKDLKKDVELKRIEVVRQNKTIGENSKRLVDLDDERKQLLAEKVELKKITNELEQENNDLLLMQERLQNENLNLERVAEKNRSKSMQKLVNAYAGSWVVTSSGLGGQQQFSVLLKTDGTVGYGGGKVVMRSGSLRGSNTIYALNTIIPDFSKAKWKVSNDGVVNISDVSVTYFEREAERNRTEIKDFVFTKALGDLGGGAVVAGSAFEFSFSFSKKVR